MDGGRETLGGLTGASGQEARPAPGAIRPRRILPARGRWPILLVACVFSPFVMARGEAEPISSFLEEIRFTATGHGLSNAIFRLDRRLAGEKRGGDGRARLVALRIDLMTRPAKGLDSEAAEELFREAIALGRKDLFANPSADPGLLLEVYDLLDSRRGGEDRPSALDEVFLRLVTELLDHPRINGSPAAEAAFYVRQGDLHRKRLCCDLALDCYRSAAARLDDPVEKADVLFKAVSAARGYRDLATSSQLLEEIARLEKVPYEVRRRALLIRGENAIFAAEHSWTPTPGQVAEARSYIDKALEGMPSFAVTAEAARVRFTLVRAMAKAGDLADAVKTGIELLDEPLEIEPRHRGEILVFVADTYQRMGEYGKAIKYYELAIPISYVGGYRLNLKIAAAARAKQDFMRAMQAYSEGIGFCDPKEGKDEIAHLTALLALMNKSVRKEASSYDSETIFTRSDDELDKLTLEEDR